MNTNKGFAPIIAIIIAVVIIAGGIGGYLYIKSKNNPIACTQEAKQCSDGSYVGRTGPKCEFTSCPNISTSTGQNISTSTSVTTTNTNISSTSTISTKIGPCGGIAADTSGILNGNTVYCDEHNRLWTPTAVLGGSAATYAWGPYVDEGNNSCINKGVSYPACNYCDGLTYAGFTDWVLPSCASGAQNSSCILYQFGIDACGSYGCTPAWDTNAQADYFYWSSTELGGDGAWGVSFFYGGLVGNVEKSNDGYVRCVRGQ